MDETTVEVIEVSEEELEEVVGRRDQRPAARDPEWRRP
jgi:hypothetical protein